MIDEKTELFVTKAIAKSTKDNLDAIQRVFDPLEERLRPLETERLERIGEKKSDDRHDAKFRNLLIIAQIGGSIIVGLIIHFWK